MSPNPVSPFKYFLTNEGTKTHIGFEFKGYWYSFCGLDLSMDNVVEDPEDSKVCQMCKKLSARGVPC